MTKLKFSLWDWITMLMMIGSLVLTIILSFSQSSTLFISLAMWIACCIGFFWLFKLALAKYQKIMDAVKLDGSVISNKALSSAPSALSTYEKAIYEEAFKDGVNFIKKEMSNVL